jgi:exosortase/archaeosortase family protein
MTGEQVGRQSSVKSAMSLEERTWSFSGVWILVFGALPLAAYWLVLIHYLGVQWSAFEQYNYGWSVPFLCLYLIWDVLRNEEAQADPLAHSPTLYTLPSPLSYLLLSLCALLYAVARFVQEANPTWRLTSLLWTLSVIGLTLLTLQLWPDCTTQNSDNSKLIPLGAGQNSKLRTLLFPIAFFLVAVPWPSGLETPLVQTLKQLNVGATIELLGLSGTPAIQHGNVIQISTGAVGIDEACSGIRSLQATLMISLFFGQIYRLSILRRCALCLTGFALAFVFNVGRTLLLTRVGEAKGLGAIASWHDPAGVTILLGCFISLWLVALAMKKIHAQRSPPTHPLTHSPTYPPTHPHPSFSPLLLTLALWFAIVEGGTQLWYRLHDRAAVGQANWSVQWPDDPAFKMVPIPNAISGQFRYDQGLEGEWQDRNGAQWQLYYFRWLPPSSLEKRVNIHLAKTHGPEKCLPAIGMTLRSDLGISVITTSPAGEDRRWKLGAGAATASHNPEIAGSGRDPSTAFSSSLSPFHLAVHQFEFEASGRTLHVFYGIYEDQTGSAVLANRRLTRASRIEAALTGSRNYGQRFLEAAVWGYDRADDAKSAFVRELENLIKVR